MKKYQIYKICSRNSDKFYVGYTKARYILQPYRKHLRYFKAYKTMPRDAFYQAYEYHKSFRILEFGRPYFVLIETIETDDISIVTDKIKRIKQANRGKCINGRKRKYDFEKNNE